MDDTKRGTAVGTFHSTISTGDKALLSLSAELTSTAIANSISSASRSRIIAKDATPLENSCDRKKKRRLKKKTILKGLTYIFRSGKSSSSSNDDCDRSIMNSLGTVSLDDDIPYDDVVEENYGNYEEYKCYSSLDFLDCSSSPLQCKSEENEENYVVRCRNVNKGNGIIGFMIDTSTMEQPLNAASTTTELNDSEDPKSLIEKAEMFYCRGQYRDALPLQLRASDLIKSKLENTSDLRLQLEAAVVEYQICKTKYALLKESSNNSTEEEKRLARKRLKNGRFKTWNRTKDYYREELCYLDGYRETKADVSNLEMVGYRLHLLHTLGDIYVQKLAQYSHALEYYNEALELEMEVLSSLQEAREDYADESAVRELKKRSMTIRATRKKIGTVYYFTGRLNIALMRTFPPNIDSSK